MKLEKKKVSELKPAPYNPRIDVKENKYFYEKLYRSIKQFGLVEPIVWNKRTGHVVGGNQRLQILKDAGIDEVDVVVVDLPLEEEKALNIALNKITGDWDKEKLAIVLDELNNVDDFLMQLSGFDEKELNQIIDSHRDVQEDDFDVDAALEREPKYQIKRGDIYQLGNHRLMCGDATNPDDVERLMDGKKADMVFTDPPYDFDNIAWFDNLLKVVNKDGCEIFVMNSDRYLVNFAFHYFDCFNYFFAVELSPGFLINNNMPITSHDLIAYFRMGKTKFKNLNDAFSTHLKTTKRKNGLHRHEKNICFFIEFIKHFSDENNIVVDLFGGSGTTLVACEQLNRICYMMEIDPTYCSVIIERWEKLTGKKPKYVGNYD